MESPFERHTRQRISHDYNINYAAAPLPGTTGETPTNLNESCSSQILVHESLVPDMFMLPALDNYSFNSAPMLDYYAATSPVFPQVIPQQWQPKSTCGECPLYEECYPQQIPMIPQQEIEFMKRRMSTPNLIFTDEEEDIFSKPSSSQDDSAASMMGGGWSSPMSQARSYSPINHAHHPEFDLNYMRRMSMNSSSSSFDDRMSPQNQFTELRQRRNSVAAGSFICPHEGCQKTFTTASNCKSHQKTHESAKPFVCNDCGSTFARGHDLSRHMRIHQDAKEFVCECCERKFNRRDALNRHHRSRACSVSSQRRNSVQMME